MRALFAFALVLGTGYLGIKVDQWVIVAIMMYATTLDILHIMAMWKGAR